MLAEEILDAEARRAPWFGYASLDGCYGWRAQSNGLSDIGQAHAPLGAALDQQGG